MAAESGLLEGKRRVEYRDLEAKSYISRCPNPQLPFQWTINPYRGCEIGCKYCYARYTHEFMELRDGDLFETRIFAKRWNPLGFRRELARLPFGEIVALGTATDPYQPAERRYKLTRSMLEEFATQKTHRLWITTKSDLVRRDVDVLKQIPSVHVNVTITTMDAKLARLIEPYAPRPELRMEAVRELRDAGIEVGVSLSPILPMINDSQASINGVVGQAAEAGGQWVWHNVLFLKSCARAVFLPFVEREFPDLIQRYRARYAHCDFLNGPYVDEIRERVDRARVRYEIGRQRTEFEGPKPPQLVLPFEFSAPQSTCK